MFSGRANQLARFENAHYLPQTSFICYSESHAMMGSNDGLVFAHREWGSVVPQFESVMVLKIQQDFCDIIHPVLKVRESSQDTGKGLWGLCSEPESIKVANRAFMCLFTQPSWIEHLLLPGNEARRWGYRDEQRETFWRSQGLRQINTEGAEYSETTKAQKQ